MKHPSICLWLHHSTKPSHNFVVKATNKQPKQRLAVRLEKKTDHIKMHEKQMMVRKNKISHSHRGTMYHNAQTAFLAWSSKKNVPNGVNPDPSPALPPRVNWQRHVLLVGSWCLHKSFWRNCDYCLETHSALEKWNYPGLHMCTRSICYCDQKLDGESSGMSNKKMVNWNRTKMDRKEEK